MAMYELSSYDRIDLNELHSESVYTSSLASPQLSSGGNTIEDIQNNSILNNDGSVRKDTEECAKVYCKRCGRVLQDVTSRILGMGPTCYKLYKKERDQQINLFCLKGWNRNNSNGNR